MGIHLFLHEERQEVMEYTFLAALAAALAVLLDRVLGTRLLVRGTFWVFIAVMFGFKLLVNGYLTWRPIVLYGDGHYLGIRLVTIPLEDFLYGFSLLSITIIIWEFFRRKASGVRNG